MCTGIPNQDSSSTTQSCQISEPHRIWGPRLLPAHQACSAGLVGLAIVAAIQAELEMTTSSRRANQQMPRHPTHPTNHQMPRRSASSSTDQQMPRHSAAANQQMPRHSITEEKPRHCIGKSKGPPSIFTISTPSCLNASAPQFSSLCFLCKRPLPSNKDIYMYRGDQAFCSQQCRYHQMAVDESKEKLCSRAPTFATTKKCHTHSCTTTTPNYYKHKERIFAYAETKGQSKAFFYANIVNF